MSNKILKRKFKKVDYLYSKWEKNNFSVKLFANVKYQEELAYEYVNKNYLNVKLSSGKLASLVSFICSNNGGKSFKLNDKYKITIKSGALVK